MISDIKTELERSGKMIDAALGKYLAGNSHEAINLLLEAERYSVMSGGKRIRPFLTLEFCRLAGGEDDAAIPFACAVELIHSYSLIHDDLPCMDNSDERRGKPSCHKQFGEVNALLAGDALLTCAFEVCASNDKVSPNAARDAVKLLAGAAGNFGMVGGQAMDIYGDTHILDFSMLVRLETLKTGALIKAAAGLGCIAGGIGKDDKLFSDACGYAWRIGLAFQIIDDILDYENGEEDAGKTTFLSFMTKEEAYEYAGRLTDEAKSLIADRKGGERLVEFADYLLKRRK